MQYASTNFKQKLGLKSRQGSFELTIEDIPYIFKLGIGFSVIVNTAHIVKFGEGFKFGDWNSYEGRELRFGDLVSENYIIGKISNIYDISDIMWEVTNEMRCPANIPVLELEIILDEYFPSFPSQDNMIGKYAELKYGIGHLMGDDIIIFAGYILEWKLSDNGKKINFSIEHPLSHIRDNIFGKPSSILTSNITAASTSLTIEDASDFPSSGYVKIDNELIKYTGKSSNQLTGLTRGAYDTTATTHSGKSSNTSGAKVIFVKVYNAGETLINVLLHILCSTGKGTNGSYDILPEGCGLAISQDFIDFDSFTNYSHPALNYYNNRYGTSISVNELFQLCFWEEKNASEIINSILYILSGFLILDNDCKIKLISDDYQTSGNNFYLSQCNKEYKYNEWEAINKIEMLWQIYTQGDWKMLSSRWIDYGDKTSSRSITIYIPIIKKFTQPTGKPGDPDSDPESKIDVNYWYIRYANWWNYNEYKNKKKILSTFHTWRQILFECGDWTTITDMDNVKRKIIGRKVNLKNMSIELKHKERSFH